ncbi:alpha/beta hydrolase [Roseiconus lacunae]|uniref:alpha/beta hydrolase n=1 Tax=Roseiconus lacunae TaxID=2605694 RepID=UPI001E468640|nr:alpha/beta hydrolase-fold protein [Roseiconus lacunae]MCD0458579.1 esterase family protein [Roseiconus lacunae]
MIERQLGLAMVFVLATTSTLLAQQSRKEPRWVNPYEGSFPGLKHHVLDSKSVGQGVGYVVWTPPDYDAEDDVRYPVVYFLHGAGGSETSDAEGFAHRILTQIEKKKFPPVICVFPNGVRSGYRGEVESMIVSELIPLIDNNYATQSNASGRAIAGFSMGGAGSVRLSILHPELFCGAGSWGGALSWRGNPEESPLLPAAEKAAEELKSNNFSLLTINGDKDHPDGFAPLKRVLNSAGIPHEVVTLPDTNHNLGKYYTLSSETMLDFLASCLNRKQE